MKKLFLLSFLFLSSCTKSVDPVLLVQGTISNDGVNTYGQIVNLISSSDQQQYSWNTQEMTGDSLFIVTCSSQEMTILRLMVNTKQNTVVDMMNFEQRMEVSKYIIGVSLKNLIQLK